MHFLPSTNDDDPRPHPNSDYGGEEGVHAVRCTLAVIRSAELGRPVRVEEIGEEYTAY